ncbi:protein kinase family protein [Polaribacter uvawellassae]|uniref:protein kinase family protein n=1 Tax=Polaribacter uvawellassae TaxID=3133495 RepID=UPI00321908A9
MNYILSNSVSLNAEFINGIECYYLETNSKKYKTFKINKSIYDFTLCFKECNTFKNVLKEYKESLQIKDKESLLVLENALKNFFDQLISERVLIKEGTKSLTFERTFLFKKEQSIGAYKIIENLANNRLTDVYLVKKGTVFFVIKLLNPTKIFSEKHLIKYKNLLRLEHSFLQKFNSPFINKTIGYYSTNKFDYIVLEYIKGLNIYKFIKKNKPKLKEREQLILEILKAFSIIHKKNVYHGDIHFGNILVTKNNKIKIIDFGLSNNVETSELELKHNIRKRNGGVHYFIPPERIIKDGNFKKKYTTVASFSAEVYQIGMICYSILFYKELFNSETWKDHIQDKLNFDIEKDTMFINRKRLNKFHRLIIKSLKINPEERFKDAPEMLKFITQ